MTKILIDEAVVRQALGALELEDMACRYEKDSTPEHIGKAIADLQQALGQPVKEQCWMCGDMDSKFQAKCTTPYCAMKKHPAEQEPVAWMDIDENGTFFGLRYWSEPDNRHEVALYTFPLANANANAGKPWVGLTDEEIWEFWWARPEVPDGEDDSMEVEFVAAVRRVLAKLKEKNT